MGKIIADDHGDGQRRQFAIFNWQFSFCNEHARCVCSLQIENCKLAGAQKTPGARWLRESLVWGELGASIKVLRLKGLENQRPGQRRWPTTVNGARALCKTRRRNWPMVSPSD